MLSLPSSTRHDSPFLETEDKPPGSASRRKTRASIRCRRNRGRAVKSLTWVVINPLMINHHLRQEEMKGGSSADHPFICSFPDPADTCRLVHTPRANVLHCHLGDSDPIMAHPPAVNKWRSREIRSSHKVLPIHHERSGPNRLSALYLGRRKARWEGNGIPCGIGFRPPPE